MKHVFFTCLCFASVHTCIRRVPVKLDEIRRIFRGRDKLNNFLITFKNKEKN